MNENENTRQQCLGDTLKADLRAKFIPLIAYKKVTLDSITQRKERDSSN